MKSMFSLAVLTATLLAAGQAGATVTTYRATMSGLSEAVPNASPGAGIATFVLDDTANTLSMTIPFFDLVGATTAAHIHCCTALPMTGTAMVATTVPTFAGFPTGVQSGLYVNTLDLLDPASYNPDFLAAHGGTPASAEAFLISGIGLHEAYANIHTTAYPGGEIRGFLVPLPIPEPSSWAMLGIGLAGIGFCYRKRA